MLHRNGTCFWLWTVCLDEVQDEDDLVAMLSTQQQPPSEDGVSAGDVSDDRVVAPSQVLHGTHDNLFGEHDDIGDAVSFDVHSLTWTFF